MTPARPTEAELEILAILWDRGPATVRDVHEEILNRRPAQYTTVLKTMQIMAAKNLVRRDENQRSHIYTAAKPREWTQKQIAGDLLERAFAGSARNLLMGALSSKKATRRELAEIRQMLDEYEQGTK